MVKQIELIDKYKFFKAVIEKNFETFVIYLASLKILVIMLILLL